VLLGQTGDPMRAYMTGDLDALDLPDAALESRSDLRLTRACVRALCGEADAAAADAAAVLSNARSTGFHRPQWAALAAAALCQALRGRPEEAGGLLAELVGDWRKVSVMASGEWVCKAAQAWSCGGGRGDGYLGS
jgi:hypothetical protein